MVQKHRRFPCLAAARYMVAAVVTLLALVIVVMMVTVSLHSDNISISVVQGYIEAITAPSSENNGTEVDKLAYFRIRLSVRNPNAGKVLVCGNISGYVLDVPHFPLATDMVEIYRFRAQERFRLGRQASRTFTSWYRYTAEDEGKLSQIGHRYGWKGGLKAMVLLETSIFPLTAEANASVQGVTHHCLPVVVSTDQPSPAADITCKPGKGLQS